MKVMRRRYIYLGMGKSDPPPWLVKVSERPDCDAVFLAFSPAASLGPAGKIRVVSGQSTTWTTGRNALYQEALRIQQAQGWSHEYYIFADYDAGLTSDHVDIFHRRISAMQPALAGVGHRNKCDPWPCSADVDAKLNAWHVTAAPIFLPYDAHFDVESWWGSQALMITLLAVSAPDFVVEFTDLAFQMGMRHSKYPRGYIRSGIPAHLASKVSSCAASALKTHRIEWFLGHLGRGRSCHTCALTAACQNSTFCEGQQEAALKDYGKLVECKPF